MSDFSNIYNTSDETDKVYLSINQKFNLNIDRQIKDTGFRFESFHEIHDLVNDTKYYSIGIENTDLNFHDRKGLFEALIKFVNQQIANIPNELEELESQRQSRDFNDYRHFDETEALSEKEGNLNKLKSKLLKESKNNI